MGVEKIQKAIDKPRQEGKDYYSIELSCVISRLSGLSQLMVLCGEAGNAFDLQEDDIAGIGLILSDILGELRKINQELGEE